MRSPRQPAVTRSAQRLPSLYLNDFTVREILRLPDAEERWLRECWGVSQEEHNPVFGRLDALVDFTSPMWKETLRFVEPNMMGIGGLHMVPTCERLIADIVGPALRDGDVGLELAVGHDMRELLTRELLEHIAAIGSGPQVCFVEPKYAGNGPDEQEQLARYLRERHGFTVMHADPSELELRQGVVWHDQGALRPAHGASGWSARPPARLRAREPRGAGAQAEPGLRRGRDRDRAGGHPRRMGASHVRRAGGSGGPLGGAAARLDPGARVPRHRGRWGGAHRAVLHGDGLRRERGRGGHLARASQKQVVNVAQHGGICGVLVSHSRPAIGAAGEGTGAA